jgi:hypothetical protein
MVISSRRTALRKAVNAYRAEHEGMRSWAHELLDRLASSDEAAEAFERLKLKDGREREFVSLCILVAQLARRFPELISKMRAQLKRLKRLDKAITDLRSFVREQELSRSDLRSFVSEQQLSRSDLLIPRLDPLPMWGFLLDGFDAAPRLDLATPDDFAAVAAMTSGLELISEAIREQRHVIETVLAEYGATRKKHMKDAPTTAAIRHLKDGVRRFTGKPHGSALREFVPVIFGCEVPDDVVTYALRPLKKERVQAPANAPRKKRPTA